MEIRNLGELLPTDTDSRYEIETLESEDYQPIQKERGLFLLLDAFHGLQFQGVPIRRSPLEG